MAASGTAILDFGAFPGTTDAIVAVTGQAGIVSGSLVGAWIRPVATAEHSADEHRVEGLFVVADTIAAGTGFTVFGRVYDDHAYTKGSLLYGTWTVAWAWT